MNIQFRILQRAIDHHQNGSNTLRFPGPEHFWSDTVQAPHQTDSECDMVPGSSPDLARTVSKKRSRRRYESGRNSPNHSDLEIEHLPDHHSLQQQDYPPVQQTSPHYHEFIDDDIPPPPRKPIPKSQSFRIIHSSDDDSDSGHHSVPRMSNPLNLPVLPENAPILKNILPDLDSFAEPCILSQFDSDSDSVSSLSHLPGNALPTIQPKQAQLSLNQSPPITLDTDSSSDHSLPVLNPQFSLINNPHSSPDLSSNSVSFNHLLDSENLESQDPSEQTQACTSSRPQRSHGQKARSKINSLFIKYGDFVHLKDWERGAAPRPIDDSNFHLSPSPPILEDKSSDDNVSFPDIHMSYENSYVQSRRLPPVLHLKSRTTIRTQKLGFKERASELFDRMVVAPPVRQSKNNRSHPPVSKLPLLDRFLCVQPDDPHPVRVGSRSIRTSIITQLAASTTTDSSILVHKVLQRLYGFNCQKTINVDYDTQNAVRKISTEYSQCTPSPAIASNLVKTIQNTRPTLRQKRAPQPGHVYKVPQAASSRFLQQPSKSPSKSVRSVLRKDRIRPNKWHKGTPHRSDGNCLSDYGFLHCHPANDPDLGSDHDRRMFDDFNEGPTMIRHVQPTFQNRLQIPHSPEWTERNIIVRALTPPDSCIFCVITYLSGEQLQYAGPPLTHQSFAISVDTLAPFLHKFLNMDDLLSPSFNKSWSNVDCHAITSFIDSNIKYLITIETVVSATQILNQFLDVVLDKCDTLIMFDNTSPTAVSLANMVAWTSLWLMQLNQPHTQSNLPILCTIVNSHPDPLISQYFDTFQALLLMELTASINVGTSHVFSSVLSAASISSDQQWRILLLAQELGHCLHGQFRRSFPCWDVLLKYPMSCIHNTARQNKPMLRASFARILVLCHKYKWDISHAKILLVYFRDMFLDSSESANALRIFDLVPCLPWDISENCPLALQFLWLLDSINDHTECREMALQLLPTNFACTSISAHRLLFALAIRCEIDLNPILCSLNVTSKLASSILRELISYFADKVKDIGRFQCVANFIIGKLALDNGIFESGETLVRLLIDAWEFNNALIEDMVFAHHPVFTKLLGSCASLHTRAASLQLIFTVIRPHVRFQVLSDTSRDQINTNGLICPDNGHQTGLSNTLSDFDDQLSIKNSKRVLPFLVAIESMIIAHNVQIHNMVLPGINNPFATAIRNPCDLYLAAITVAAIALKLHCSVSESQFSSIFDMRLANYRWPSKLIPQTLRCQRTMLIAVHCLKLGCEISEKKLTELFIVAAFAKIHHSFDQIALELIRLILFSKRCEFLLPCWRNIDEFTFISKENLVKDVFFHMSLDIRDDRPRFRNKVYRLLPQLRIIISVVGDISSFNNVHLRPLHDLVEFINLEASLTGIQLPPEFLQLVYTLHGAQSPKIAMSCILKALETILAQDKANLTYALDDNNFSSKIYKLLVKFDVLFDEGKYTELAQSMATLTNTYSANKCAIYHRFVFSGHTRCQTDGLENCPHFNPLRKLIVSHLCNRIGKAQHWSQVVDILNTLSHCYEELNHHWCPVELDRLWTKHILCMFVTILQGTSSQCQELSSSIWRLCSVATYHQSFLSNKCTMQENDTDLSWSVPRLLFPLSVLQVCRMTNFTFETHKELLHEWSNYTQAILGIDGSKHLYSFIGEDWMDCSTEKVLPESNSTLFKLIMTFWAQCYHGNTDIRNFLFHTREFEWHLEQATCPFSKLCQDFFINQTLDAFIVDLDVLMNRNT